MKKMVSWKYAIVTVFTLVAIFASFLIIRFYLGKQNVEKEWQAQQQSIIKIKNCGVTKKLEILPLLDWYKSEDEFKTENGVSYLIKTDTVTILFDVGLNLEKEHPSPLLQNMKRLGVDLDDIDAIVISHNHGDHVGGFSYQKSKSFSLTKHQIDLGTKTIYTPISMTYPNQHPICSTDPTPITQGVSTIGTISNQLFFMGYTPEQALAINVKGKGVVLVVGCGHQGVQKILTRAQSLFDEPIYGLVGGLHYPVTESRAVFAGIQGQQYFGTGKAPWNPITIEDVKENINIMKKFNLTFIALSAHDSCDYSISTFRKAFPESFQVVKVGKRIIVN